MGSGLIDHLSWPTKTEKKDLFVGVFCSALFILIMIAVSRFWEQKCVCAGKCQHRMRGIITWSSYLKEKKTSVEGGVLSCCTEIGATLRYQSCCWSVFCCVCLLPYRLIHLSFPDGLAAFRTFLKTEFSDENIEFWMACEEYKKIKSSTKLVSKANKIFKEFIDIQAPREVCVCVWGRGKDKC